VLNACRSWRYAEECIISSKDDAAKWARSRAEDPSVIDSALAIRRGDRFRSLDPAEVRDFVLGVKARIKETLVDLPLQHVPHLRRLEEASLQRRVVDPASKRSQGLRRPGEGIPGARVVPTLLVQLTQSRPYLP